MICLQGLRKPTKPLNQIVSGLGFEPNIFRNRNLLRYHYTNQLGHLIMFYNDILKLNMLEIVFYNVSNTEFPMVYSESRALPHTLCYEKKGRFLFPNNNMGD
jgi:hypothetical protein